MTIKWRVTKRSIRCSAKAFKEDRANFDNPKALYLYFSSLVNLHEAGKKDLQEVFDVYDNVTEKIEEENAKYLDQINTLLPKEEAGNPDRQRKAPIEVL